MLSKYFRYASFTGIVGIFTLTLSLSMLPPHVHASGDDDVAALVVDNGQPISVPEPSTVLLLGLGIAGLAFWRTQSRCN
ncbi:MAG: PEP-CTERM sorting domain-containing protein [Nitrospira sp.]|nr:PEP-CTERM sorting domain-containing protein [Nitrospira sp.]